MKERIEKWNRGVHPNCTPRRMIVESSSKPIHNTGRVERMLKMIVFLNEWRTLSEMAEHLQVSKKTIHRNTHFLVDLGFEVHKLVWKRTLYRIVNTEAYFKA